MKCKSLALQTLALSAVGIGMFFNVIFHLGTAERVAERHLERRILSSTRSLVHGMVWQDWFKEHQFYQVSFQRRLYLSCNLPGASLLGEFPKKVVVSLSRQAFWFAFCRCYWSLHQFDFI